MIRRAGTAGIAGAAAGASAAAPLGALPWSQDWRIFKPAWAGVTRIQAPANSKRANGRRRVRRWQICCPPETHASPLDLDPKSARRCLNMFKPLTLKGKSTKLNTRCPLLRPAAVPLFSGWNCVATQRPWRTAHTKVSPYSEQARAQGAAPSAKLAPKNHMVLNSSQFQSMMMVFGGTSGDCKIVEKYPLLCGSTPHKHLMGGFGKKAPPSNHPCFCYGSKLGCRTSLKLHGFDSSAFLHNIAHLKRANLPSCLQAWAPDRSAQNSSGAGPSPKARAPSAWVLHHSWRLTRVLHCSSGCLAQLLMIR